MLSIPRRRPIVWALCAMFSAALWAALLSGLLCGMLTGREAAGVGLMFAGGWNLSLLPVHARPWTARRGRSPAVGGGVADEEPRAAEA